MKTSIFINDQTCNGNKPFYEEAVDQYWYFHNDYIWDRTVAGDMAFWAGQSRIDFLRMWCAT